MDEELFEDLEEENFEFDDEDFEVMEMSETQLMTVAEREGFITNEEE
jgi:hypothetical protein